MAAPKRKKGRGERAVGVILLLCMSIVAVWYVMALRSRRPFDPFTLTAQVFASFSPDTPGTRAERRPVGNDPREPNIVVYRFHAIRPEARTVLVRLVHGYNMCDCMRIKGFDVKEIEDKRLPEGMGGLLPRVQVWELTSSIGDRSVWVTSMLAAPSFAGTAVDVRSVPFPRVGVPDEIGYSPEGITWEGMKHPVRNTKRFLRAHWNKSRCDLSTALGLKRPAWLQETVLTLVSITHDVDKDESPDRKAIEDTVEVHRVFHRQLVEWGRIQELGSSLHEE